MPIEIHTPDKLEYIFYPAHSDCLTFRVRSASDANLALTSGPCESDPMFEIFLGGWSNTKSVIRKNRTKPDVVEVNTPQILSAGEFRGFWVRWYDNVITVGREGEDAAFMSWEEPGMAPVRYVGICTGWGANGTWLFDEDQSPDTVLGFSAPTGSGPGCWVPAADGAVPPGAVAGGFDGPEHMYVARAFHQGSLIPGKLHSLYHRAFIAWGGREHEHQEYEVLCACDGHWEHVSGNNIPPNALPAGETANGEILFIGRCSHRGALVVGKVQPSHGICYISWGGREEAFTEYEVFVTN